MPPCHNVCTRHQAALIPSQATFHRRRSEQNVQFGRDWCSVKYVNDEMRTHFAGKRRSIVIIPINANIRCSQPETIRSKFYTLHQKKGFFALSIDGRIAQVNYELLKRYTATSHTTGILNPKAKSCRICPLKVPVEKIKPIRSREYNKQNPLCLNEEE